MTSSQQELAVARVNEALPQSHIQKCLVFLQSLTAMSSGL